jgi:cellulose synthase/poly-beta-1,6-N-acetylglucosamine synthase-like glycosyltransferase
MMAMMNIKPRKPASAGALFGLFFMLLFGIAFAFLIGNVLVENEAPVPMYFVFGIFMIGWLGTVIYMLVYHFLNLKRAKGLSLVEIDTESGFQINESVSDPMQKLRSLEALKKDGLISEDEFRRKREEVMQQKW